MKKLFFIAVLCTFPLAEAMSMEEKDITITLAHQVPAGFPQDGNVVVASGYDKQEHYFGRLFPGETLHLTAPLHGNPNLLARCQIGSTTMHTNNNLKKLDDEHTDYLVTITGYKQRTHNPGDPTNPPSCTLEWTPQ